VPAPRRKAEESLGDYRSRLIRFFSGEGRPHKQAVAIAMSMTGKNKPPVTIETAHDGKHKYVAVVHGDPAKRRIPFGAYGMSDYNHHKDPERKARYITRHKRRENWDKSGRLTAGFYSLHLLWGPTTSLRKNVKIMLQRYWPEYKPRKKLSPQARRSK
jgi:hypothetical protein